MKALKYMYNSIMNSYILAMTCMTRSAILIICIKQGIYSIQSKWNRDG
jgi:hypothetical protein